MFYLRAVFKTVVLVLAKHVLVVKLKRVSMNTCFRESFVRLYFCFKPSVLAHIVMDSDIDTGQNVKSTLVTKLYFIRHCVKPARGLSVNLLL